MQKVYPSDPINLRLDRVKIAIFGVGFVYGLLVMGMARLDRQAGRGAGPMVVDAAPSGTLSLFSVVL